MADPRRAQLGRHDPELVLKTPPAGHQLQAGQRMEQTRGGLDLDISDSGIGAETGRCRVCWAVHLPARLDPGLELHSGGERALKVGRENRGLRGAGNAGEK